ncbi:outer membrane lipid asymmetry maintenance protein MlaD [Rhodobacter capsulatus]|uniref:outer membrane lipid asymmetry maintenance protein MlaD n=1 Tax=Rhodobacter capsulatus TaxID=1061 RepID=UPI004026E335
MSENRLEVLTGAAVLAVAVGFFVWAGQGHSFGTASSGYPLKASFRSVEGISVGTDVRMAGVKVGTITDIALNPQTFFADTTVAMKSGIDIPDDSQILIATEGLLGGAFVEILPGGSPINLGPGEEIVDTQGAVSALGLMMKFAGAKDGDKSSDGSAP